MKNLANSRIMWYNRGDNENFPCKFRGDMQDASLYACNMRMKNPIELNVKNTFEEF